MAVDGSSAGFDGSPSLLGAVSGCSEVVEGLCAEQEGLEESGDYENRANQNKVVPKLIFLDFFFLPSNTKFSSKLVFVLYFLSELCIHRCPLPEAASQKHFYQTSHFLI